MQFFSINIFILIFIIVDKCTSTKYKNYKNNEYVYNEHSEPLDCTEKKIRFENMNVMRSSTCFKPIDTFVDLTPKPGFSYYPSVVRVKRCGGHCAHNTCAPTKTQMRQFTITRYYNDLRQINNFECVRVDVEEHLSCKCMCPISENDCHPNQKFFKNECVCGCMDREIKKERCEQKMGMRWSDADCSCTCSIPMFECPSNFRWDSTICKCMK